MLAFIAIVLILSFLVFIHEVGHYVAAKMFKINVHEFGLGYPPKALKLFRAWQTDFTLNWIPFGGFVRMQGEDGFPEPTDQEASDAKSSTDSEATFTGDGEPFFVKPAWQRLVVILAGATVNFVFGIVAFSLYFSVLGLPVLPIDLQLASESRLPLDQVIEVRYQDARQSVESVSDLTALADQIGVRIEAVVPDSPAEAAGVSPQTQLLEIQTPTEAIPVETMPQAVETILSQEGQTIKLVTSGSCEAFSCDDTRNEYEVYVRTPEEAAGEGAVGVSFNSVLYLYQPAWRMPLTGGWYGLQQALMMGRLILNAVGEMVVQLVTVREVPQGLAGPVGIVHQTHQAGIVNEGFWSILNFAGLLSINLAVMNVLPIPALDGGQAVFIVLERIIGRDKIGKYQGYATYLGMGLLLTFIVAITIKDVIALFS